MIVRNNYRHFKFYLNIGFIIYTKPEYSTTVLIKSHFFFLNFRTMVCLNIILSTYSVEYESILLIKIKCHVTNVDIVKPLVLLGYILLSEYVISEINTILIWKSKNVIWSGKYYYCLLLLLLLSPYNIYYIITFQTTRVGQYYRHILRRRNFRYFVCVYVCRSLNSGRLPMTLYHHRLTRVFCVMVFWLPTWERFPPIHIFFSNHCCIIIILQSIFPFRYFGDLNIPTQLFFFYI